jgi:hypothetical protein
MSARAATNRSRVLLWTDDLASHRLGPESRCAVSLVKSPSLPDCSELSLMEWLVRLSDPRHRRGVRHPFVAVLLIAASAVVAGARSYAAIGQWARSAPQQALARLGAGLLTSLNVRDRAE